MYKFVNNKNSIEGSMTYVEERRLRKYLVLFNILVVQKVDRNL